MQRWIPFLVGALLLAVGVGLARQAPPDVVRIHVVAHSDSRADQQAKYRVRDALLGALPGGWSSAGECLADISARSAELEALVNGVLKDRGLAYTARVETGVYRFPARVYGEEAWPAGRYRALKVILGDGAGQNWWCVLYPELCLQPYEAPEGMDAVTGPAPVVTATAAPRRPAPSRAAPEETPEVRSWVWDRWVPAGWKRAWRSARLGAFMESHFTHKGE